MTALPTDPALRYRGRFAPTPSGLLHLGSLMTALASFLQARKAGGHWLLRMDDLDEERCRLEYADGIRRQLEAHALFWDQERIQSQHLEEYAQARATLAAQGLLYACTCTRKRLAAFSLAGPDGTVYDGHCRTLITAESGAALRFRAAVGELAIEDAGLGRLSRRIGTEIGDFVVWRADGRCGYQLASVVDDAALDIGEIVRGADLIGSSLRQACLRLALQLREPVHWHLPLVTDLDGRKLSKQNHAEAVDSQRASQNLLVCLKLLRQQPPAELASAQPQAVLAWATEAWQPARLSQMRMSEARVPL